MKDKYTRFGARKELLQLVDEGFEWAAAERALMVNRWDVTKVSNDFVFVFVFSF